MIWRILGLTFVCVGIYLALQVQLGAALFLGITLLSIGCWLFLGPLASFGSRGQDEPWNPQSGGGSGESEGDGD